METCNTGINIEHKQIQKNILTDDENYHGTQYIKSFFFGICLLVGRICNNFEKNRALTIKA